jgi:uncharacterized phage protein (predicted DNA packaging)
MSIVSLSLAKNHLRVDQSEEDSLIQSYIDAAEQYVEGYINRTIPGSLDSPVTTPKPIISAILLIVGDLYENRLGASEVDLKENKAVVSFLYPYRVGIGI